MNTGNKSNSLLQRTTSSIANNSIPEVPVYWNVKIKPCKIYLLVCIGLSMSESDENVPLNLRLAQRIDMLDCWYFQTTKLDLNLISSVANSYRKASNAQNKKRTEHLLLLHPTNWKDMPRFASTWRMTHFLFTKFLLIWGGFILLTRSQIYVGRSYTRFFVLLRNFLLYMIDF